MGNPKAALNGIETRWKTEFDEPTKLIAARIPLSISESIDNLLEPGQSRSAWLREQILEFVEKKAKEQSVA